VWPLTAISFALSIVYILVGAERFEPPTLCSLILHKGDEASFPSALVHLRVSACLAFLLTWCQSPVKRAESCHSFVEMLCGWFMVLHSNFTTTSGGVKALRKRLDRIPAGPNASAVYAEVFHNTLKRWRVYAHYRLYGFAAERQNGNSGSIQFTFPPWEGTITVSSYSAIPPDRSYCLSSQAGRMERKNS
jgi:hypothetical protein